MAGPATRTGSRGSRAALALVVVCVVALLGAALWRRLPHASRQSAPGAAVAPSAGGAPQEGSDPSVAPGLQPAAGMGLVLPVERTHDFAQLDPSFHATALGHDPRRIFEFVRDSIRFELYQGALRGSRGTLLALAGNSVNRAILLSDLLKQSGQSVRFARGSLDAGRAATLASSMWARRGESELPPAVETAAASHAAAALAAIQRDYQLLERLVPAGLFAGARQTSLESILPEAQAHYWVQWARGSDWIDLDPSFADASPGRRYTDVAEVLGEVPERLYHTVSIRLVAEEYGAASPRRVLSFEARAADLSGRDAVLVHVPENWEGPSASIKQAIAAAIQNRGRVRPILIVGSQIVKGEVVQTRYITSGLGAVTTLLGQNASRTTVPLVSSEWLELEFRSPDGRRETVTRDVFDFRGQAWRAAGRTPTWDELTERTNAADAFDPSQSVLSMLVTTGHIHPSHVLPLPSRPVSEPNAQDGSGALRALLLAFVATTDDLWQQFSEAGRSATIAYPDTPRVQIAELFATKASKRIRLDLRRDEARMVSRAAPPGDVFRARLLRGVLHGTIERKLLEALATTVAMEPPSPAMSTSLVFERAAAQGRSVNVLSRGSGTLPDVPDDVAARLRADLDRGLLLIVPSAPVNLEGSQRFAWWRIDPGSGETTAVTDDGLYGSTGTESAGQVGVVEEEVVVGNMHFTRFWIITLEGGMSTAGYQFTFRGAMVIVAELLRQGHRWIPNVHPSWIP